MAPGFTWPRLVLLLTGAVLGRRNWPADRWLDAPTERCLWDGGGQPPSSHALPLVLRTRHVVLGRS
jgi:hypothetical protein